MAMGWAPKMWQKRLQMRGVLNFLWQILARLTLRQHLDEQGHKQLHIMTLHGCQRDGVDDHIAFRITPVLNDLEQLSRWRICSQQRSDSLPALLHIDTGMNRLGFDTDQIDWLIGNKSALDGLDCRYLMSHLVSAEVRMTQQMPYSLPPLMKAPVFSRHAGKSRQQRRQYIIARLSFSDDTPRHCPMWRRPGRSANG